MVAIFNSCCRERKSRGKTDGPDLMGPCSCTVQPGKFTKEDESSTAAYVPAQLRLEGHAGAILRVVCRLLEETGELAIATAAEDRSVRTWIVSNWFTTRQFSSEMIARCSTFVGHEGRVYDMVLNSQLVLVSVSEVNSRARNASSRVISR